MERRGRLQRGPTRPTFRISPYLLTSARSLRLRHNSEGKVMYEQDRDSYHRMRADQELTLANAATHAAAAAAHLELHRLHVQRVSRDCTTIVDTASTDLDCQDRNCALELQER